MSEGQQGHLQWEGAPASPECLGIIELLLTCPSDSGLLYMIMIPGAELAPTLETFRQPARWPAQAGSWGPMGIIGYVCILGVLPLQLTCCVTLVKSITFSGALSLKSASVSVPKCGRWGSRKEPDLGAHMRLLSHLPQPALVHFPPLTILSLAFKASTAANAHCPQSTS